MLVHQFLENAAQRYPDKTALQCGNRKLTYQDIDKAASIFAASLRRLNINPQDRIVIYLENSPEVVIALFGALKAAAVFVILNPAMKSKKLGYILKDSGAKLMVANIKSQKIVYEAVQGNCALEHIVWYQPVKQHIENKRTAPLHTKAASLSWSSMLETNVSANLSGNCIDIDLATIIYTSGSTGNPKGVMSTHSNMVCAARSIVQYIENTPDDIIFSVLPLSFDYGLYQVIMSFCVGATLVLEKHFIYPLQAIDKLIECKATGFPVVPTMLSLIFKHCNLSELKLPSLRYVTNTAAHLPSSHIKKLHSHFPHLNIFAMYGLTECKRVSYLPPADIERKPDSVGIPIPNTDVFIVDEDGRRLEAGQVGELVVRGSHVMQGYWNNPQETEKSFRPGRFKGETFLYTGDLFMQDEEGYLYYIARKDDMIKTKGERVSPKEVEACLYDIKQIVDAAVIGIPDRLLGQALKAFISVKKNHTITTQQIRRYCQQHLEPFMVPKYFEIRSSLPKNNNGKVDKKMLRVDEPPTEADLISN